MLHEKLSGRHVGEARIVGAHVGEMRSAVFEAEADGCGFAADRQTRHDGAAFHAPGEIEQAGFRRRIDESARKVAALHEPFALEIDGGGDGVAGLRAAVQNLEVEIAELVEMVAPVAQRLPNPLRERSAIGLEVGEDRKVGVGRDRARHRRPKVGRGETQEVQSRRGHAAPRAHRRRLLERKERGIEGGAR